MSKRISSQFILFVLISLLCISCEKLDRSPGFIYNMSKLTITESMSNNYPLDPQYPDTMLPIERTTSGSILPFQKEVLSPKTVSWKSIYDVKADNDTLSFFIYDVDTLDKYPWKVIRENYMILQRYDLSIYDFRKLNYTIYYPPTEAMRNMKMWPAYEE